MAYHHKGSTADGLARGLGWFSVALGMTELLAGHRLARALGMEEHTGLIRVYGAREVATGLGILAMGDPAPWMWGRVGGDALDLATLAPALDHGNPKRGNVRLAMAAVAGVAALDVLCAGMLRGKGEPDVHPDYSGRSGLPRPAAAMRGAARDAPIPADLREPAAMRPARG